MSKDKRTDSAPLIRDRVKRFARVKASELVPNPKNWRKHPAEQRAALTGILREIGYADALLVRELPDQRLMLIDGELRRDVTPDQDVPVLVLDVTEAEADKLLAVLDPLGAMALADDLALASLTASIETDNTDLAALLESMSAEPALESETELRQLDVKPPPKMTWCLIGIPTVQFGSIAELVEKIAENQAAVVETTANDG